MAFRQITFLSLFLHEKKKKKISPELPALATSCVILSINPGLVTLGINDPASSSPRIICQEPLKDASESM